MTAFKILIAAGLISAIAMTSANAQLPLWASQHPGLFQAEYPDRDVLSGGALTPAGRMGLELPGGAAPAWMLSPAHSEMGSARLSSQAGRHHSYEPVLGTLPRRDGRRHPHA
jgi:hypothetical protein